MLKFFQNLKLRKFSIAYIGVFSLKQQTLLYHTVAKILIPSIKGIFYLVLKRDVSIY